MDEAAGLRAGRTPRRAETHDELMLGVRVVRNDFGILKKDAVAMA